MLDVKLSKIQDPKFVSIFCIWVWKFKFWETRKFDETINSVKNHICVSRFYHVRVCVCVCVSVCVCLCVWVCVHVCVLFTMGVDFLGLTYAPTSAWYGWGRISRGRGMLKIFRVSETPPSTATPPPAWRKPRRPEQPPRASDTRVYMDGSEPWFLSLSLDPSKQTYRRWHQRWQTQFIRQICDSIHFYTTSSDWEKKKSFGKNCETNQWSPVSGKCKKKIKVTYPKYLKSDGLLNTPIRK